MGDSILSALGVFEGMSSIVVLCVLIVWFTRQVILTFRERQTSTTDLAGNTIQLLNQEQEKTLELNNRVDDLYAENRKLRSDIHTLQIKYDDLTARYENAVIKIESLEKQLTSIRRNGD